jgi:DNA polymerase-3 subunit alpha
MPQFVHLHTHTEFSLLDGAAKIEDLAAKACACGMPALAISDHGNMYGVPKFVLTAKKNKLKPIIGSEFYLCDDHRDRTPRNKAADEVDERGTYHQILFAKNETGYRNLVKLSSISYTEGFYYKPRIDRALLKAHSAGLVATTCCLASEINQAILNNRLDKAEETFKWYLEVFGEDYYVELQRHGIADQDRCNAVLLQWAQKYNVKVIATNDVHYVNQEDSEAHDLLLALQTASDYSDLNRFRFTYSHDPSSPGYAKLNPNFYFKTPDEMAQLFHDHHAALDNTIEIADKCSFELKLTGDLFLPTYRVPQGFDSMDGYLAFLSWEGAKKRYGALSTDITERIENELGIIKKMGFAGYFLIVQEFTNEARKRGVFVGPGRGSAAGSVVAYVTGITDIDPLQYGLLFERFLNPERISPPDIDIDFDDEGREAVINFVVERYGRDCVSQIITYGTMGAKTAIRDVGRTLQVPLPDVNRIAKFIPDRPDMDFKKALNADENPDGYTSLKDAFASPDEKIRKMMQYAQTLEGTARHTGIHAAGVIIAPGPVSDYVPVALSKDKIVTTQWDGPSAEKAGMLKMDFLGLKTLSIIKTALRLIETGRGVTLDIDNLDLHDAKTYELYQHGDTVATFQFESDGMRKYLRQLKPTVIEDLIAMNALYRPGPMDNIPEFIDRKQGRKQIRYPHPMLEGMLSNTYGIMVYQEQIMEVARKMGGYTLGGADLLRRAMGKKDKSIMEKERAKFIDGAQQNGVDEKTATEVFDLMEKFAEYGFNKSHSAAYSLLAFRTAYLKAHYPAEYMTAVLSHNIDNMEKITFFIEECRRMGIAVLPPSVNESEYMFSVRRGAGTNGAAKAKANGKKDTAKKEGDSILFGLGAIKGIGQAAAEAVIEERKANGPYKNVFDLTARLGGKYVSKKVLESLVYAGALDGFGIERSRYIPVNDNDISVVDLAVQYGNRIQADKVNPQASLFGDGMGSTGVTEPEIPFKEPWPAIQQLNKEKEVIGFYLSAHPLDKFKAELKAFANATVGQLAADGKQRNGVKVGGIVTAVRERLTKNGARFGVFTLEDYSGALEFSLFSDRYAKFKGFLEVNNCVYITGSYGPRFQDADALELKVEDVRLLDNLMEDQAREMSIGLSLDDIQPAFIDDLHKLLANFKGKCNVKFHVADAELPQPLSLHARGVMVRPCTEVLQGLDKLNLTYNFR